MAFFRLILFAVVLQEIRPFPTSLPSSSVNERPPSYPRSSSHGPSSDSGRNFAATLTSSSPPYNPNLVSDAKQQPDSTGAHISQFTDPNTGLNPFVDLEEGTSVSTSRTIAEERQDIFSLPENMDTKHPALHILDVQVQGQPRIPTPRYLDQRPDALSTTPEDASPLPQQDEHVLWLGHSTGSPWEVLHDRFQPKEGTSDNRRGVLPVEDMTEKRVGVEFDEPVEKEPAWSHLEPVEGDSSGRRLPPIQPEEGRPRHRQMYPIPTSSYSEEEEEDDDALLSRDLYPSEETSFDFAPNSGTVFPSKKTSATRFVSPNEFPDQVTPPVFYYDESEDLLGYTAYPELTTPSTQETAPTVTSYSIIIIGATVAAVSAIFFGVLLAFCTWRRRAKRLANRVPHFLSDVESKSEKNVCLAKVRANGLIKQ